MPLIAYLISNTKLKQIFKYTTYIISLQIGKSYILIYTRNLAQCK